MEKGYHTYNEIFSQPAAWSAALKMLSEHRQSILSFDPAHRFNQVIFTGCGSTYYLALSAAALTQELTGLSARAFPASELWLSPRSAYSAGKTLLVAVSRSGETTETLRACEAFRNDQRGELISLSCYGDMPLAQLGALNMVLSSGQEQSVAQTRAFSTLYLGTVAMAAIWAGRAELFGSLSHLSEAGTRLLKNYAPLAVELGRDASIDRFYFLGSGPRFGLACELSLKMKEMSLSHSEPFHFLEFRHGPKSMVTPSTLIIGLLSEVNGSREAAVLEDVKALGGRILDIAETGSSVKLESGVDEAIHNVLYLPIGQMIAFERSISKNLNPDQPTNLDTVVKL
jgi:glucosamine--fructose-6-phosphate aminotransferase (isomerizing)